MTYSSIASSLWFWLAAAFIGAGLATFVWSLLRMASVQSRAEEREEAERFKAWLEMKRKCAEREAEWRKYHGRKGA